MREVADDVWVLSSFPPNSINAWVAGDVLIDAQTRRDGKKIVKQIGDRKLSAHALTHAHPDHQGASHHVCTTLGIPYWVAGGGRRGGREPEADPRAAAVAPDRAVHGSRFTGPPTRSTGRCATGTRSGTSGSSTRRATRPGTSCSGGRATKS